MAASSPDRVIRSTVSTAQPQFPSLEKIVREVSRSRVVTPDELLRIAVRFDKEMEVWRKRTGVIAQAV